jgi:hypothetical protein
MCVEEFLMRTLFVGDELNFVVHQNVCSVPVVLKPS